MRRVLAHAVALALVAGAIGAGKAPPPAGAAPDERVVVYNTSSHKFHCPTCEWAVKCDKHCVRTTVAAARKQGGVPCKVCGGECAGPVRTPKPAPTPKEED